METLEKQLEEEQQKVHVTESPARPATGRLPRRPVEGSYDWPYWWRGEGWIVELNNEK